MKYEWKDLPKPLNCFTVRNATMVNLNNNKIIQHYSANTKIVVVQKCVTPTRTYYRTQEAVHHYLNYAFEAAAFGLPNEYAPPAHHEKISPLNSKKPERRTPKPAKKQTNIQKTLVPKGGEGPKKESFWKKLFRRKNG